MDWKTLLGLTRDQVEAQLGPPAQKGITSCKYPEPQCWLYGSIEIYFDRKTRQAFTIFDDPEKNGTGQTWTRDKPGLSIISCQATAFDVV